MKKIIILLVLAVLNSCNYSPEGKTKGAGVDFDIVEIEGCEYVLREAAQRGFMAHKGNCKNPIHTK